MAREKPKRRIRECYKCRKIVRQAKMHLMYYTGMDKDVANEMIGSQMVEEKGVYLCSACYVDCGYYLKSKESEELEFIPSSS